MSLKPCPFCGGDAELVTGDERAAVVCVERSRHRIVVDGDNNAAYEAVVEWNTRTPLEGDAGSLVKDLRTAMKAGHSDSATRLFDIAAGTIARQEADIQRLRARPSEEGEVLEGWAYSASGRWDLCTFSDGTHTVDKAGLHRRAKLVLLPTHEDEGRRKPTVAIDAKIVAGHREVPEWEGFGRPTSSGGETEDEFGPVDLTDVEPDRFRVPAALRSGSEPAPSEAHDDSGAHWSYYGEPVEFEYMGQEYRAQRARGEVAKWDRWTFRRKTRQGWTSVGKKLGLGIELGREFARLRTAPAPSEEVDVDRESALWEALAYGLDRLPDIDPYDDEDFVVDTAYRAIVALFTSESLRAAFTDYRTLTGQSEGEG